MSDIVYSLSFEDAVYAWIAKWKGEKVRVIGAKFDVDPRRLYEVWEEITHIGSRKVAWERFQRDYPVLARQVDPSPHVPTRMVTKKDDRQLGLL